MSRPPNTWVEACVWMEVRGSTAGCGSGCGDRSDGGEDSRLLGYVPGGRRLASSHATSRVRGWRREVHGLFGTRSPLGEQLGRVAVRYHGRRPQPSVAALGTGVELTG